MRKYASYIAQRILERKVNQKQISKENQEIINYFKITEDYLDKFNNKNDYEKKKKIYEFLKNIDENEDFKNFDANKLSKIIYDIKNDIEKIIDENINNYNLNHQNPMPGPFTSFAPGMKKNKVFTIEKIPVNNRETYKIRVISPSPSKERINFFRNKYNPLFYNSSVFNLEGKKILDKMNNNNYQIKGPNNNYGETQAFTCYNDDQNTKVKIIQIPDTSRLNIDAQTKLIIDIYFPMNMQDPNTFKKSNFKLFYTSNEYFRVPLSETSGSTKIVYPMKANTFQQVVYEGEVNQKLQRHGLGKLSEPNSIKIGMWKNNIFSGWGREIKKSGQIYEGRFVNNMINGKGVYKFQDAIYIGDFENGMFQGKGILLTKNIQYNGMFSNDMIHGLGKIIFLNLSSEEEEYDGEFNQKNIEGKGIMKWRNGNMFQGEMKNGKMNGVGRFFPKNGIPFKGIFKDNIRI